MMNSASNMMNSALKHDDILIQNQGEREVRDKNERLQHGVRGISSMFPRFHSILLSFHSVLLQLCFS